MAVMLRVILEQMVCLLQLTVNAKTEGQAQTLRLIWLLIQACIIEKAGETIGPMYNAIVFIPAVLSVGINPRPTVSVLRDGTVVELEPEM